MNYDLKRRRKLLRERSRQRSRVRRLLLPLEPQNSFIIILRSDRRRKGRGARVTVTRRASVTLQSRPRPFNQTVTGTVERPDTDPAYIKRYIQRLLPVQSLFAHRVEDHRETY